MYSVHCTVYSVQCTVYIVQSTLYIYYILYINIVLTLSLVIT